MGGALKCLRGGVSRKVKNAVELCKDLTKPPENLMVCNFATFFGT